MLRLRDDVGRLIGIVETDCIDAYRLALLIRKLVDNAEQIEYTYKQIGIAIVYANTVCITQFIFPLKMFNFHPYTTIMLTHITNRILEITFNGPLKYIYVRHLSVELQKIIADLFDIWQVKQIVQNLNYIEHKENC